jgi:hypothetical protein
VSPNQQKAKNKFFFSSDITRKIIPW